MQNESGENITLKNSAGEYIPCRRCGGCPAHGINWIREDGISIFKHDVCGKKMQLGLTAAAAMENQNSVAGMNKADENRKRAWREDDARQEEEMRNKLETAEGRAELGSLEKAGFLWANFMG